MKYTVLIGSLFLLGCSGGESGDSDETTDEGVEDIAGAYHDALDKAADVEAIIEQEKVDLDAALEVAEGNQGDSDPD
ncbi:MAG: hypothetical protein IH910_09610 [Proteobacteria bacterium]|nr:hypothetical protein [Pseudomonadota bacterium]